MKSKQEGAHKRKNVRKRVTQVIMVVNSFTGESLGRIGNLSTTGMMLISPRLMGEEHYFQVGFQLSAAKIAAQKLEVGVQCLWCDEARSASTYWVGCKIIDISDADQVLLKRWVDQAEEIAS
jgi:hypothetical protein